MPEARGLDVPLRGLSMVRADNEVLAISGPLFDGLYVMPGPNVSGSLTISWAIFELSNQNSIPGHG